MIADRPCERVMGVLANHADDGPCRPMLADRGVHICGFTLNYGVMVCDRAAFLETAPSVIVPILLDALVLICVDTPAASPQIFWKPATPLKSSSSNSYSPEPVK